MKNRAMAVLLAILLAFGCLVCVLTLAGHFAPDFSESEGSAVLNVQTYFDGEDQPTHPMVIDMGMAWNGWRYWMTYSPYPNANGGEENPCVAVSNDMLTWTVPEGLYNPIAFNEETACDELKDPHILYNEDLDRLEVWYLGRIDSTIDSGGTLLLFRKTSYDGVHWSDCEVMTEFTGFISPSVAYINGIYCIWAIRASSENGDGALLYMESADGKEWMPAETCCFAGNENLSAIWHGAVSYDDQYRFVYIESSSQSDRILYAESMDGVTWSSPEVVIEKKNFWDGFYRPCILRSDGMHYCIYGVITQENEWYLSMSKGASPDALCGITVQEAGDSDVNSELANRQSFKYTIRNLYGTVKELFRPELLVLDVVVALIFLLLGLRTLPTAWGITWLLNVLRFAGRIRWMSVQELSVLIYVTGFVSLLCLLAIRGCVNARKEM